MNTKPKIIAVALVVLFAVTPLLVSASVSGQSLSMLATISNAFQGYLASIFTVLSKSTVNMNVPTTPPKAFVPDSITLQLGEKSVLVAILQQSLISAGYLKGPATGVFGTSTQVAVEAFQKAKNLTVTGYIKVATSSLASSFAAASPTFVPIGAGTNGAQANAVQTILIKTGNLKISKTTGYFGAATEAAVKAFQKAHDLPQTGIIDEATFAAMNGN